MTTRTTLTATARHVMAFDSLTHDSKQRLIARRVSDIATLYKKFPFTTVLNVKRLFVLAYEETDLTLRWLALGTLYDEMSNELNAWIGRGYALRKEWN